ncbi:MAG: hypothetical protein PWQ57_3291 [Desulfovibrionales bacterium]|nr:hypothetical protein [Desulfovibrionales bacterium]
MIVVPVFSAAKPRISPRLLDANNAQIAENCDLQRGTLAPLAGLGPVAVIDAGEGDVRTIYKLQNGDWRCWTTDVDVAEAAVNDANSRIHYTGDGYPKQTDATGAVLRLGLPQPSAPLTVQLSPASPADDAEIARSASYVYTFVTEWGEESEPSPPTAVFDVYDGQDCLLTGFEIPSLPGTSISGYRIYRLNAGESTAEYQLVPYSDAAGDMPADQTSFTDDVKDSELSSEVLPTEGWSRPPDAAKGLLHTGNGLFFCFDGRTIYVSESFIPYAYPTAYTLTTPADIVALGRFDQAVVVLTQAHPHVIQGIDPESLSMDKMPYNQACVAKRSVVNAPLGVIYASPYGLFLIGPEGPGLLTSSVYTKRQWAALHPASLIGFYIDNQYVGFFSGTNAGIVFDFESGDVGTIKFTDRVVYGGHIDPEDDSLYLLTNDGSTYLIEQWKGSESPLVCFWKSKEFFSSVPMNLGAARIYGEQSPGDALNFTTYANGELLDAIAVTDNKPFRLKSGTKANDWSFSVSGTAEAYEVRMGASIGELQNGV